MSHRSVHDGELDMGTWEDVDSGDGNDETETAERVVPEVVTISEPGSVEEMHAEKVDITEQKIDDVQKLRELEVENENISETDVPESQPEQNADQTKPIVIEIDPMIEVIPRGIVQSKIEFFNSLNEHKEETPENDALVDEMHLEPEPQQPETLPDVVPVEEQKVQDEPKEQEEPVTEAVEEVEIVEQNVNLNGSELEQELEQWLTKIRNELDKSKKPAEVDNTQDPKSMMNNVISEKKLSTIAAEITKVGKPSVLTASEDGNTIAIGSVSGLIVVFNLAEEVLCGLGSSGDAPVTSTDMRDELLAVGYENGAIRLWNFEEGKLVGSVDCVHNELDVAYAQEIREQVAAGTFDPTQKIVVGRSPITNIKFIGGSLLATDADGMITLKYSNNMISSSLTFKRVTKYGVRNAMDIIIMPSENALLLTYDFLYLYCPATDTCRKVVHRSNLNPLSTLQTRRRLISLNDPMTKTMSSNPNDIDKEKLYTLQDIKRRRQTAYYDALPCISELKLSDSDDMSYAIAICWGRDIFIYHDALSFNDQPWPSVIPLDLNLESDIVGLSWIAPHVLLIVDARQKLLVIDPVGRPEVVQTYNVAPLVANNFFVVTGSTSIKKDEEVYISIPDYRKGLVSLNTILFHLGESSLVRLRVLNWQERFLSLVNNDQWDDAFTIAFQFRDGKQSAAVGLPTDKDDRFQLISERIEEEIPHYLASIFTSEKIKQSLASFREEKIRNATFDCIKYILQVCSGNKKESPHMHQMRAERLIFSKLFGIYRDNGRDDMFYNIILDFIREKKLTFVHDPFLQQFVEFHLQTSRGKSNRIALLTNLDDCLTMLDISKLVNAKQRKSLFTPSGLSHAELYSTSVHAANLRPLKDQPASSKSLYIANLYELLAVPPTKLHDVRRSAILLKFLTRYLHGDIPHFDVDRYSMKKQVLGFIFGSDLSVFKLFTKQYEKHDYQTVPKPSHTFYAVLPTIAETCHEMLIPDLQKVVLLPLIAYASGFMSREISRQNNSEIPDPQDFPLEYYNYVQEKSTAVFIAVILTKIIRFERKDKLHPSALFTTENTEIADKDAYEARKRVVTKLRKHFNAFMVNMDKFMSKFYDPLMQGDFKTSPEKLHQEEYKHVLLANVVAFIHHTLISHVRSKHGGAKDPSVHIDVTRNAVQQLISSIVFRYNYFNMAIILKNIQRMITGDSEDEPLFDVAKHMYDNIVNLKDDDTPSNQDKQTSIRSRMRDWYLGVIYPKYVKAVGASTTNSFGVNKDAIRNLIDPFISSLNHDVEYDSDGNEQFVAHKNIISWIQDTMHNPNADRTHKFFLYEYIEAELKNYGSGQESLQNFCRANDLLYNEFFSFYLNLYCMFQEHYLLKPFLEKYAKKIKSSNETYETVMRLCKNIPEAKAFLLEMRGEITTALKEIIKDMSTHLSRLQSVVITNSELKCNDMLGHSERINENYANRIIDDEVRAVDKVVEDFDLITQDKFVFIPSRPYSDQELEQKSFLEMRKKVKLPPVSLSRRLIALLQCTSKEWTTIGETVTRLRRENSFIHDAVTARQTREKKANILLNGVKNQTDSPQNKTALLFAILELLRMPTIPRNQEPSIWEQDLSPLIEEQKKKHLRMFKRKKKDEAVQQYESQWAALCQEIYTREEQDVTQCAEFKDLYAVVENAIVLCRTNSERNTLEDSQVQILWFMLLDQFLRYIQELRNNALKLVKPDCVSVVKKQVVDEQSKKKLDREKQAKELDNLLADSDSDEEQEQEEYDPDDLSFYDTEMASVEKDILDCQKELAVMTRELETFKGQLNNNGNEKKKRLDSPRASPATSPKSPKTLVSPKSPVSPSTGQLVETITKLENRITQKKMYIDYLRRRKDELDEEKVKLQNEINRKNDQLQKMNILANLWMQRCLSALIGNIISAMMKYVDIPLILNKITKDQRNSKDSMSNNQFHRIRTTVMRILSNYRYEHMLLKTQSDLLSSDMYNRGSYFFKLRQKGTPPNSEQCAICSVPFGGIVVREIVDPDEKGIQDSSLDYETYVFQCEHHFHKTCCVESKIHVCPLCHKDDERNAKIVSEGESSEDTGKLKTDENTRTRPQDNREKQRKAVEEKMEQIAREEELKEKGRKNWQHIDPRMERYDGVGTLDRLLLQQKKKEEFELVKTALELQIQKQEEQKMNSTFADRVEVAIRGLKTKLEEISIEYENNMVMLNNIGRLQSNSVLNLASISNISDVQVNLTKPVEFTKGENIVDVLTENAW